MRPALTSLRHQGDFRVALSYSDGLVAELDFTDYLTARTGLMLEPLKDEFFFSQSFIDHGVLTWPNGYDICPDVLRAWTEAGSVLSPADTNVLFAERSQTDSAALV